MKIWLIFNNNISLIEAEFSYYMRSCYSYFSTEPTFYFHFGRSSTNLYCHLLLLENTFNTTPKVC